MNKITGINLNGNAYQLEEPGFVTLSKYLAQAKERLSGNPDQQEIMADLEQAIADKFQRFLSAHKSVITEAEVETVIQEMGPVGGENEAQTEPPASGPKRLYRIPKGEMIAGVATGLAAYFDIDVVIVRLIMVVLTIITSGGFIFGYILAWIIIPPARTQEQQAAASGAPFNAEELIARAKTEYAKLDGKRAEWKSQWKDWRKEQRRQQREYKNWKQYDWHKQRRHRPSALGELIWIVVLSFFVWLGYHHVPSIHDFLDAAWHLWQRVADQIAQFLATHDQG